MKEVFNHKKGFFHSDSFSPYFYIVLLRELDSVVGKEMERDEKMILGKGIVTFVMSMIMICLVGNLFLIENCAAAGTTIYVRANANPGGDGTQDFPYKTIHEGIAAALAGDTVSVFSGTYNENVYIDKSLNLIGSSKPVINGNDSLKSTIEIMSDNVTISGFEIHNTKSSSYHGIAIGKTLYQQGDYTAVTISNCYISDAYCGIIMKGSAHMVNLCEIYSNDYYAIDIISGGTSDTLTGNVINNNLRGINLQSYCTNNIIRDNTISGNRDYGIQLAAACSYNQIYHNRFIQNYPQVRDIGTNNSWDNGYPSGGNYWSDYTGYDNYSGTNQDMSGSDNIGDIPYIIPGGQNKDNYPTGLFQTPKQSGDENQPPNAYIISISPNPAESGQLVSLSGCGSDRNPGIVTAYEWRSTIDGKISDQPSFQTINLSFGVHTISFKVQDNDGAWSIEQKASITINSPVNLAPIAYIDEITPNPTKQREAVLFRGHGTDDDGFIIAYKWLSSKDGVISTESSFSKTNLSLGTHTIYFQVKDNTEWSPQAIRTLVVEKNSSSNPDNQAPIADVGGPYQGNINGAIMFDGAKSYDEEGAIVGYWNFGDNSSGTGLSPTHVYTTPGTYIVTLTVTDEDGDSTTASTSVAITQSTSQGNNAKGYSVFDLEIPFPIIIIVVFLSVLGVIIGFILRMKRG